MELCYLIGIGGEKLEITFGDLTIIMDLKSVNFFLNVNILIKMTLYHHVLEVWLWQIE
jgi:hypothetical protein